jgi:hypothetical protein
MEKIYQSNDDNGKADSQIGLRAAMGAMAACRNKCVPETTTGTCL